MKAARGTQFCHAPCVRLGHKATPRRPSHIIGLPSGGCRISTKIRGRVRVVAQAGEGFDKVKSAIANAQKDDKLSPLGPPPPKDRVEGGGFINKSYDDGWIGENLQSLDSPGSERNSYGNAEQDAKATRDYSTNWDSEPLPTNDFATIIAAASGLAILVSLVIISGESQAAEATGAVALRVEPANALSIPTWAIHVSSLVEWLVAMGLVWQYADVCGNQKWKGLTWGMLPLHTSGICACTYHFFYNSDKVESLVALQAFLTCVGNFTLWWAAYRIFLSVQEEEGEGGRAEGTATGVAVATAGGSAACNGNESNGAQPEGDRSDGTREAGLIGFEDLGQALSMDNDLFFVGKLAAISIAGAYAIKYGSLLIDLPFEADLRWALAIIFVPSGLNVLKWLSRSSGKNAAASSILEKF